MSFFYLEQCVWSRVCVLDLHVEICQRGAEGNVLRDVHLILLIIITKK